MEENRQIVKALRKGDVTVFERIYKSSFARLLYYSASIVKDREIAWEIVQSLFVSVWEKRRLLDPERSLKNYLLRSVHNNSVLYIRSRMLHNKHHAEIGRMDDDTSSDAVTEESERHEKIPAMIARLPQRSRQVIYMSYFENKRSREIAQELGITVRTVETIIYQAIKKMKKYASEDT